MSDFTYEITRNLGILSESTKGWRTEVNLVRWNERRPKLDIRDWGPEHSKIGKGISLNTEETAKLKDILDELLVSSQQYD